MKLIAVKRTQALKAWLTANPGWGVVKDNLPNNWALVKVEQHLWELLEETQPFTYRTVPLSKTAAQRLPQAVKDVIGEPQPTAVTIFDVLVDLGVEEALLQDMD